MKRLLDWRNLEPLEKLSQPLPFRFLAYAAVLTFISWADGQIFGVGDMLSLKSRVLEARILGPEYPQDHKDTTTVVLLNDQSLNTLGASWPAPYSLHAGVLSRILEQKPRAVFVDILFVDKREDRTIKKLVKVIEQYREAGVPLLFAAPPKEMKAVLIAELSSLGNDALASVRLATSQSYAAGAEYASSLAYPRPSRDVPCEVWPAAFTLAYISKVRQDGDSGAPLSSPVPPHVLLK